MVTFAETFQNWKDFPKGLSVLVVDGDNKSLHDVKRKLEDYNFIVTSFSSGDQACTALASHTQIFHVALVEATENNGMDSCKILEFSKDLPTIMMSAMENMPMMIKSIALGAVEFLLKPLPEDKLKNIWQHVVRKALDSRDTFQPGYLEPGKCASTSAAHDHHQICDPDESNIPERGNSGQIHHESAGGSHSLRLSVACERFPAPLTPQLEQGGRMALQEATLNESPRSHYSTEVYNYKERANIESNADKLSIFGMSAKVKAESKETLLTLPGLLAMKKEEEDINQQAEILCCTIPMLEFVIQTNDVKYLESKFDRKDERFAIEGSRCDEVAGVPVEVCEMSLSSTEDHEHQSVGKNKEEEDINQQAEIFCCTIPMLESVIQQTNDVKHLESKFDRKDERFAIEGSRCDEVARIPVEVCEMSLSSTEDHEHQSVGKNIILHTYVSKDSVECPNADSVFPSHSSGQDQNEDEGGDDIKRKLNDSEQGGNELKCSNSKKKIKVDWTADLHRRFVQAVDYLGVEQAIPSRILEVMKVDGLTRHNVASHLQKYRSHKKRLFTREVEASNWHQNRLNYGKPGNRAGQNGNPTWIQPRPQLICPPLYVWGHPTVDNPAMHVVPRYMAGSNTWQAPDNFIWKHPMVDSWVPGMPSGTHWCGPHMKFFATSTGYHQGEAPVFSTWGSTEDAKNPSMEATHKYGNSKLRDLYPPKDLLDAAISEALSNPCTPPPLGLKPPSMESVMAELQRQGINTLSPCT